MAWYWRLGAETAVKNGVRRRWRTRLRLCALGKKWRGVQHGRLDDHADENRDVRWNLRGRMIGVLGIGLAVRHAERLLAVMLRGVLFGHVGAGRHCFHRLHRRLSVQLAQACRAGIGGRCQLD